MDEVRLLVISDDIAFRASAAEWIARQPGLHMVGATNDRREAISLTIRSQPHAAFVGSDMLAVAGYDVAGAVTALSPGLRRIAVTHSPADWAIARQHACAFDGFVSNERFDAEASNVLKALFPAWRPGTRSDVLLGDLGAIRRVLQASPAVAFIAGVDGTTRFVNRAATQLTGWGEAEIVGRNWWREMFPGEAYAQVEALFRNDPLAPVASHEMALVTRAGQRRPMTWNIVPRRDALGTITEIVGLGTDVAECRGVENALQRLADGIAAQTGDAWLQSLVRTLAETTGASHAFVSRVLPGGARARTLALWGDGEPSDAIEYDLFGTPCEATLMSRVCWYPDRICERFPQDALLRDLGAESFMGAPLVNARGEVVGLIGLLHRSPLVDIEPALANFRIYGDRVMAEMDRMDVEAENTRRERHFRGMLDHVEDVMFSLDAADHLTFVSPSAARALGHDPARALGRPLFEFLHPDDHANVRAALSGLGSRGRSGAFAVRARHADGSWHHFEAVCGVFRGSDGERVRVVSARDITERVSLEARLQQAQRFDSTGGLALQVAGEVGNLLAAIVAFTQLAGRELPPGHALQDGLRRISASGEQANTLTRQLVALCRPSPRTPLAVEANPALAALEAPLRRALGPASQLECLPTDGAGIAFVDPAQLEQVLLDLTLRARAAMPAGGALRIATARTAMDGARSRQLEIEPGDYVTFSVSDSGAELDAEARALAFEPFVPGAAGARGPGLASVRAVVRQSEGAIEVESEPGRGTTFHVHLPRLAGSLTLAGDFAS